MTHNGSDFFDCWHANGGGWTSSTQKNIWSTPGSANLVELPKVDSCRKNGIILNKQFPPPSFQEGRVCAALDVEYGGTAMDFMTPEGFSHAMFQVLRLKPGASMTLAPVCSSWVWVNLGFYYHTQGKFFVFFDGPSLDPWVKHIFINLYLIGG